MDTITQEQLYRIEERLMVYYGISFEDLRQEIADHLACEIESEMAIGQDFDTAYKAVDARWNEKLRTNNWGIYKGIPKFIEQQLAERFNQSDWKLKLLGFFLSLPLLLLFDYLNVRTEWLFVSLPCLGFLIALLVYSYIKQGKAYLVEFYLRQTKMMFVISMLIVLLGIGMFFLRGEQTRTGVFEFFILYGFLSMCYFLYHCFKTLKKNKIKMA
ncbi:MULTISPECIES: hypothetical protein [unclassified Myroides]|uniref:hypothetical protein n=1 Tax=unclassified Myroides TaxID=2642485 RepID=UPI003D2F6306